MNAYKVTIRTASGHYPYYVFADTACAAVYAVRDVVGWLNGVFVCQIPCASRRIH